jgi:hypothetical protein
VAVGKQIPTSTRMIPIFFALVIYNDYYFKKLSLYELKRKKFHCLVN